MTGWRKIEAVIEGTRAFQRDVDDGHLSVFVGVEDGDYHLSISHRSNLLGPDGKHPPGRYPTWDEISDARYLFCPKDITMAMLLPPPDDYVNLHSTTFHMWQVPNEVGT